MDQRLNVRNWVGSRRDRRLSGGRPDTVEGGLRPPLEDASYEPIQSRVTLK
jgi:hypothetical protein